VKHWTKILFVLLFSSLIFLPKNIEAKSGCCSGHDGVNCSAGAQSNGHVICNDGTRTSSCLYSEMVMCGSGSGSTNSTVQTVQPTSTPRPTLVPTKVPTIAPIKTPTIIPTSTLVPTLTPTSSPIETPILSPTVEPTKTEEISPTSTPQPQVLGETDTKKPNEPATTKDFIIFFSILGLFGFGIYKLIVKIKNKIKKSFKKND
jgi:hypothetical protein